VKGDSAPLSKVLLASTVPVPPVGGGGAVTTVFTATAAEAVFPSALAVMVAEPSASANTTPSGDTLATTGLELLQVTTRPVSALPLASLATAMACAFCPGASANEVGDTESEAMGTACTSTCACAAAPVGAVAVTVALPTASERTVPAASTVAMAGAELDQV